MKYKEKFKIHFFLFKSEDLRILKIEFCNLNKKKVKGKKTTT